LGPSDDERGRRLQTVGAELADLGRGVYAHVSDVMRNELKAKLQRRWEAALDERAVMAPDSSLPLLNELLTARRESSRALVSVKSA
jgi:hypothetical protein